MTFWWKKKAMMMLGGTTPPTPSETPITGLTWSVGSFISGTNGQVLSNVAYGSYSAPFAVSPGQVIKRTGLQSYDDTNINMFVHYYRATPANQGNWMERGSNLSVGSTETVPSGAAYARFTFAYGSTSGKTMTQTAIDSAYGAEFVN